MRDQCHIQYNLLLQEELYKALSIQGFKRINMSYYSVLIKEYETNPEFFRRLQPCINASLFLARAVIIYHETVKSILSNIENTCNTNWEVSFIDAINDDIFK